MSEQTTTKKLSAIIRTEGTQNSASAKWLQTHPDFANFLYEFGENFRFYIYDTSIGNRLSLAIFYVNNADLAKLKAEHLDRTHITGYEFQLGEVHLRLADENRTNLHPKVNRIVKRASLVEARYPHGVDWKT